MPGPTLDRRNTFGQPSSKPSEPVKDTGVLQVLLVIAIALPFVIWKAYREAGGTL